MCSESYILLMGKGGGGGSNSGAERDQDVEAEKTLLLKPCFSQRALCTCSLP